MRVLYLVLLLPITFVYPQESIQPSICNGTVHKYCVSRNYSECLRLQPHKSFDYLPNLTHQNSSCSSYSLLDDEITMRGLLLFNLSAVNITGNSSSNQQVVVHCSENGGIVILNSYSILLENLIIVGCSFNISAFIKPGTSLSTDKSAIFIQNTGFICILKCSFKNQTGYAALFVDVEHTVIIKDSIFEESKTPVGSTKSHNNGIAFRQSQNFTDFSIQSCLFIGVTDLSSAVAHGSNTLFHHGGALDIHIVTTIACKGSILISSCNFHNNRAATGAAIHILSSGELSNENSITIANSNFSFNSALISGGAIQVTCLMNRRCIPLVLLVVFCMFKSNLASWAGGLAIVSNRTDTSCYLNVTLKGCTWVNNRAFASGFAVGVGEHLPSDDVTPMISLNVSNCVFQSNSGTSKNGIGAVAINYTEIIFDSGKTTFSESKGTALFLNEYSVAKFFTEVIFLNNSGILGGAILLQLQSLLFIHSSSFIEFINNEASIMGGAIYSMDTTKSSCVFLFEEAVNNVNVTFHNNTVNQTYQSLFIQDARGCIKYRSIFINVFQYYPEASTHHIFLPLNEVKFSSWTHSGIDGDLQLMLGESFHLEVTEIKDYFGLKTDYSVDHVWISFMNTNFTVTGPSTISLNTESSKATFYLEGHCIEEKINTTFNIYFFFYGTSTYRIGHTKITMEVIPCRLGYFYSNDTRTCICVKSGLLMCQAKSQCLCVKYRYWFSDELKLAIPCPAQNCWYMYNECPSPTTYCYNNKHELFCGITHPDDLCWDGRSGLLCSQCAPGYSFTFAAFQCANQTSCKSINTAFLMAILSTYWISSVLLILLVLSTNISIGSGFMYGIVYYFSVVNIYIKSNSLFSDLWLRIIVYICIAVTQLNPELLGYVLRLCFIEKWDNPLPHKLFEFATPLFVVIFIVGIIKITQHCHLPKFISLSENSPIHAICMLVLFSYTSLSLTSFKLIMPISIDGKLKVRSAPTIPYFSTAHIPYAVVALCAEVLLALPICMLLLFGPCISNRVNLVKFRLKPIFDEFQACYRPECRSFAGFYFMSRQLVYLADGLLLENIPQYNSVLLTLNLAILTVHIVFQPYKKKWINILDTIILTDILLLSMYVPPKPNDQLYPLNRTLYNSVIPAILILLPATFLFGSFAYILFLKLQSCFKCHFIQRFTWLVQKHRNNFNTANNFEIDEDEWQREPTTSVNIINQERRSDQNGVSSVVNSRSSTSTYGATSNKQPQERYTTRDTDTLVSNMRTFPLPN